MQQPSVVLLNFYQLTVTLNVFSAVFPTASLALTLILYVPFVLGVKLADAFEEYPERVVHELGP